VTTTTIKIKTKIEKVKKAKEVRSEKAIFMSVCVCSKTVAMVMLLRDFWT
jgi:hypothetical protein